MTMENWYDVPHSGKRGIGPWSSIYFESNYQFNKNKIKLFFIYFMFSKTKLTTGERDTKL